MSIWTIFSYVGLAFAVAYRIPQIVKVYRTKRAEDLSSFSYLVHNGAYVSFITYLVGSGKLSHEPVLCAYYIMGMIQNIFILVLKYRYRQPPPAEVSC